MPRRAEARRRTVKSRLGQIQVSLACLMLFTTACNPVPPHSAPSSPIPLSAPPHVRSQFPTPTVLSIFSFEDRTGLPQLAWLRTGLADMLIAELATNPSLIIVQRERVDEIIREQAFQLSGRVTDQSTVKIGRLVGANVLVIGRMIVADGLLRLDGQLIGVEQGTVLAAVSADGRLDDVAAVARLLVARLQALFSASAMEVNIPRTDAQMLQTAQADHNGEQLSREGKLFEALEEYERALALNPNNTIVQSHLSRTLERLPPESWMNSGRTEGNRAVLHRIVERLAMALEMDVGRPSAEAIGRGRSGLHVPVHIHLSAPVVDQALEALTQLGGVVLQPSAADATMVVGFAEHPEFIEALAREKLLTRRLYLRLLSQEGRTIAVYSDFREWTLSNWIALDGSTIRIKRGYALLSEGKFGELTPDQIAAVASVRVTLDRVPKERATVRLDVQAAIELPNERASRMPPSSESRSERHQHEIEEDKAMLDRVSPLRTLMEEGWFPPVGARPWGMGYMPSNERSAVIALSLDAAKRHIREEPRLVRASGDPEFDRAALAAARSGLQHWVSAGGFESLVAASTMPLQEGRRADDSRRPFRVRAQFQLHQDVPALNLIAPHALDVPIRPLQPPAVNN